MNHRTIIWGLAVCALTPSCGTNPSGTTDVAATNSDPSESVGTVRMALTNPANPIVHPDPQSDFAETLAAAGHLLVVGAPHWHSAGLVDEGTVSFFIYNSIWGQQSVVTYYASFSNLSLGAAVAARDGGGGSSKYAAVSLPGTGGAVGYLCIYHTASWVWSATGCFSSPYIKSVAIEQTNPSAGASYFASANLDTVKVYNSSGTVTANLSVPGWTNATDNVDQVAFGKGTDGNIRLLAAAAFATVNGVTTAGKVHIWTFSGGQWIVDTGSPVTLPSPVAYGYFGAVISASGAFFAAMDRPAYVGNTGNTLHVYSLDGNHPEIYHDGPVSYSFGQNPGSVALRGTHLVVGDAGFNQGTGRVFTYIPSGSTWTRQYAPITVSPAPAVGDNLGYSVGLTGLSAPDAIGFFGAPELNTGAGYVLSAVVN